MRIIIASLIVLRGLAAVMSVGAEATATTFQTDVPLPSPILSCTGVPLVTSGTVHTVVHETDNAGTHIDVIGNYQNGSATDTLTGVVYRASSVAVFAIQETLGASTFQSVGTFHLVGQGAAPDLDVVAVFRFTTNADGTLTAWVDNVKSVCRGS